MCPLWPTSPSMLANGTWTKLTLILIKPDLKLIKSTCDGGHLTFASFRCVCARALTCVLEACPHAFVKLAPPLPSSQLLVLLTGLQGEAVPLCLGRQVRCSLLSLLHQGAEVGLPTLCTHDCNGKQSTASVNHVHYLTGNQFSLRLV